MCVCVNIQAASPRKAVLDPLTYCDVCVCVCVCVDIQAASARKAVLDPLTYCGYQYVHDSVSNLVYLPVASAPGTAQDGRPATLTG